MADEDRPPTRFEEARDRLLQLATATRRRRRADADIALARAVARQEIASLCGLMLRRIEDAERDGRGELRDDPHEHVVGAIAGAFGEALRDFGATDDEPGEVSG